MSEPGGVLVTRRGSRPVGPRELLAMVSSIMALMALAIDLMLPAFDDIRTAYDLGEGSNETGRVITVFFMGLAVAQLVYGPLADRFGRKPILYGGIAVYLLGAVGSALAPSFGWLLVSRFVWGVGAAGSRVVATAIVRDRFEGIAMAKAMSQIMAIFVLVPIFAPSIGAGLIAVLPWRSVFWFCAIWAIGITLWTLRLGETLNPAHRRSLSARDVASGFATVVRTPVTCGYTVASIFLQGVFTAYLATSELIISDFYDRKDQFPMIFGAVAVLFGIAALVNGRLVGRFGIDGVVSRAFALLVPLSVFLVAVCLVTSGRPNFWIFMPTMGCMLALFMFLMPNLGTAALGPVGEIAGTASALTGAVRMGAGAVLGTVIGDQVGDRVTGFAVGVSMMVAGAALAVLIVRLRQTTLDVV